MAHEQYDIIFAGGGAAACVTAGRLAQMDPSLKILLVERGPHTNRGPQDVALRQPARCYYNLVNQVNYHIIFGEPSDKLGGRKPYVGVGNCVGGGSTINLMMYTRAAPSDYDDWEKLGNPGWGAKEMIAMANKAETYQAEPADAPNHGHEGPVGISDGGYSLNVGAEFLNVARAYDPTRVVGGDTSNFKADFYGMWHKYIDKKTGLRSDAASAYIYSQAANKNLSVLSEHHVVKVLLEGTKAVGVQVLDNASKEVKDLYASRLVVVAAGTLASPGILERSGIGGKTVLQKHDIQQVVDLPAVGENYHDHVAPTNPFYASEDAEDLGPVLFAPEDAIEPFIKQLDEHGNGILSTNAIDAGIRLRPNAQDLAELGPEFRPFWDNVLQYKPDTPLFQFAIFCGALAALEPGQKGFSIFYMTNYSFGGGSVHTGSATDPAAPVEWVSGYYENPADLAAVRWGYKKHLEYARRNRFYRGGLLSGHPAFPEGSEPARALAAKEATPYDAPDLVYTAADEEAIDNFHRATSNSTWHSLGTCAMMPREKGGVVDPRLNVYGTQNLKVADMSIAPLNVSGNTYNTTLMIGEKAALLIAEDLGIKA